MNSIVFSSASTIFVRPNAVAIWFCTIFVTQLQTIFRIDNARTPPSWFPCRKDGLITQIIAKQKESTKMVRPNKRVFQSTQFQYSPTTNHMDSVFKSNKYLHDFDIWLKTLKKVLPLRTSTRDHRQTTAEHEHVFFKNGAKPNSLCFWPLNFSTRR